MLYILWFFCVVCGVAISQQWEAACVVEWWSGPHHLGPFEWKDQNDNPIKTILIIYTIMIWITIIKTIWYDASLDPLHSFASIASILDLLLVRSRHQWDDHARTGHDHHGYQPVANWDLDSEGGKKDLQRVDFPASSMYIFISPIGGSSHVSIM